MRSSSPLAFIYIAAFVSITAFSMVFPLLPVYAKRFEAADITIGFIAASFALAQLLFSPLWGIASDRFGRTPIIAVGLFGIAASFLLFAAAASLLTLFLSRFLQGVFSAAVLPASRAYVADVTTNAERVKALGRLGASLMLGVVFGPAIGGLLAEHHIALPFVVGAGIAFALFLFVVTFLPESLARTQRTEKMERVVGFAPTRQLLASMQTSLAPLFLLTFLWSFTFSNNQVVVPLLGIEKFALGAGAIGLMFGGMGLVSALFQFFLVDKIARRIGEHRTVLVGVATMAGGFVAMPFLPAAFLLYVASITAGIGSALSRPVITALISQETDQRQGITMGIANTYESIGRLLGPLLGGLLFALGFASPFLFSGLVVALVLWFVLAKTHFLKAGHTR